MAGEPPVVPGSAQLEIAGGVLHLHPEDAVLAAMLSGWQKQQQGGRSLAERTVRARISTIRRFVEYTNEYPWNWTSRHVDEWMTSLVSESKFAKSTLRSNQLAIRLFCDYVTSPHYDWARECEARFGTHPVQVCHEWNTVQHLTDFEGRPGRRPLTRSEIQQLFDYADAEVERIVRLGRKGALAAYRDATILKVIYGWGLRCTEASRLDMADLYRNPHAPELGKFGMLHIRWGKASRGSAPKRRAVASVMPWAAEALEDYVVNIRPRFGFNDHPALWVTERGGRIRRGEIERRFAKYRDALGLSKDLVPHSLRHSYVTHLIEGGADAKFVQDQVGHAYASTTAIYTAVSGDFMNMMMRQVLDKAINTEEHTI